MSHDRFLLADFGRQSWTILLIIYRLHIVCM